MQLSRPACLLARPWLLCRSFQGACALQQLPGLQRCWGRICAAWYCVVQQMNHRDWGGLHHDTSVQVLRVALLALKALLVDSKLELGPEMVEAGLPRYIAQRQQQVLSTLKPAALAGSRGACEDRARQWCKAWE